MDRGFGRWLYCGTAARVVALAAMPEENAPLEELLEAAEAAVGRPSFSLRPVAVAAVSTGLLLVLVSLTLAVASGGRRGQEARLLESLVPRRVSPDAYRARIQIVDTHVQFAETPFGTQEVQVSGVLDNRGDRVLARADLVVTLTHLFRDEQYEYTFTPVTPSVEGISQPGPLLARTRRAFAYRIADIPGDVAKRDVRVRWAIGTVLFHEGLPIPMPFPEPTP